MEFAFGLPISLVNRWILQDKVRVFKFSVVTLGVGLMAMEPRLLYPKKM